MNNNNPGLTALGYMVELMGFATRDLANCHFFLFLLFLFSLATNDASTGVFGVLIQN